MSGQGGISGVECRDDTATVWMCADFISLDLETAWESRERVLLRCRVGGVVGGRVGMDSGTQL